MRQIIATTRPDLLLLGGDLVDRRCGLPQLEALVSFARRTCLVGAIGGNHDRRVGIAAVQGAVERAGGVWLDRQPLAFFAGSTRVVASAARLRQAPPTDVSIHCTHYPNPFGRKVEPEHDIVFAGHLHGCQCTAFAWRGRQYPGAWFYRWNGLRFSRPHCVMLVSRGLRDAVPLRVNCPREVVLCDCRAPQPALDLVIEYSGSASWTDFLADNYERGPIMLTMTRLLALFSLAATLGTSALAGDFQVLYKGGDGPGRGKHVVLISGDEEYRSEEFMPQLGKILARRHGFTCTVLFAVNPKDGTIDPDHRNNIPGLEALETADLMMISTRFRDLPDEQMRYIDQYVKSGRPIIGIRTATHAFCIPPGKKYSKYSFDSREWAGGFGRQILGETWINHHGHHGFQSTARMRGQGHGAKSDRPRLRRHLVSDRRLRRSLAAAGRLQAVGPRPGSRRDEAERQAGRRGEEQPDDARRLDEDIQGVRRPGRPRLYHHDGLRPRFSERGPAPPAGQRRLLVRGAGGARFPPRPTSIWSAGITPCPSAAANSATASPRRNTQ